MTFIKVEGLAQLRQAMKGLPERVGDRARRRGLMRAGTRLKTIIRRAVPVRNGILRRAIVVKRRRRGDVVVGLGAVQGSKGKATPYYYKTLEFGRKGGPPLNPFFMQVVNSNASVTIELIIEETKKALAFEAGRAVARVSQGRRI